MLYGNSIEKKYVHFKVLYGLKSMAVHPCTVCYPHNKTRRIDIRFSVRILVALCSSLSEILPNNRE